VAETGVPLLLVDDDEVFCATMARALGRRGYAVTVAHDSATALERAPGQRAAVIDLRIGEESGLALIAELHRRHPELAMVVLTGYASIATAVEAVKLGARHYLTKPADAAEVDQALRKARGDPDTPIAEHPMSVDRLEWEHLQRVLMEHGGNISAAARALGMHRRTLQRKLQKRPVRR